MATTLDIEFNISEKQQLFRDAEAVDEVFYGGAAGGGKTYVQVIDAYGYALKYPFSKQLILRRTFPELERSIIRVSRELYSKKLANYNESKHTYTFRNGSVIDFGYCDSEGDVTMYMSAEYDVIRLDEATHFTEYMYLYLLSRIRGTRGYPKQMKCSSNPGNVGHVFFRDRFVTIGTWGKVHNVPIELIRPDGTRETKIQKRLFIPSLLADNPFIMKADPDYMTKLMNLPEKERQALLYGNWDIYEGQYFSEWRYDVHTCEPFELPAHWRRYTSMDYGLDMLSHHDYVVDDQGNVYVPREIYESGLIVSNAAAKIKALESEDKHGQYVTRLAPPDLWNTQSTSGKSTAILFDESGLSLTPSNNDRISGWLAVHELLKIVTGADGKPTARLKIFRTCKNLIRTIPLLQHDDKKPNDVAREPHELTHAPDDLRYFANGWTGKAQIPDSARVKWEDDQYEDYYNASAAGKKMLIERWGNPFGAGAPIRQKQEMQDED